MPLSPRPPVGSVPRAFADLAAQDVFFVALEDGTEVAVRNDLRRVTTYVLIEQGRWFEHEWDLLPRIVGPGDTVFDVGANHGVYALPLARRVGSSGRVVAFEPGEDPASLMATAAAKGRLSALDLRRVAVTERDDRSFLLGGAGGEEARIADDGVPVPTRRLDTVWRELGRPELALLKVDAEGAEERVFEGARELLAETSPVVMFEISGNAERGTALSRRLAAYGFAPYRYLPRFELLVPLTPDHCDGHQLNLLALKPGTAAVLAERGLLVEDAGPDGPEEDPESVATLLRAPGAVPPAERLARARAALRHFAPRLENGGAAPVYPDHALVYRLLVALGEIERAGYLLGAVQRRIEHGLPASQPILALAPWLDDVPAGDDLPAWVRMDILDRLLRGHNWSSRFLPGEILGILEELRANPFFPEPLERRRQLRRTVRGLQPALEPGPATAALRVPALAT